MDLTIAQIEQLYYRTRGFRQDAVVPIELNESANALAYRVHHVIGYIKPDGSGECFGRNKEKLSNFTIEHGRSLHEQDTRSEA